MESVVAALVTGVLTLAGVLVFNSRSRAVMEVKIDNLARQVEGHNRMVERTYALERDVAVAKAEIEGIRKVPSEPSWVRLCWRRAGDCPPSPPAPARTRSSAFFSPVSKYLT